MKFAVFSAKSYDRDTLGLAARNAGHEAVFFAHHLNALTAASAKGFAAVCAFVNDQIDKPCLAALQEAGVRVIALRCAGFNQVDLRAAGQLGIAVCRVPAYSPEAVAELTVALMLTLARKIHKSYLRVREGNFSLEGLVGMNLHGKTVGLIGTGRIGICAATILRGFGCKLLAYDVQENPEAKALGARYVALNALLAESDIVTLHCPLTPATHHLIGAEAVRTMKPGAMFINTSRGAIVDAQALIEALKNGRLGAVGLDVYEEESDLFFEDLSDQILQDDVFAQLLTFPNVVITGHQGFFTIEALQAIAEVTCANLTEFEKRGICNNAVSESMLAGPAKGAVKS